MNSGTCASVALPERSSRGITRSASTRTRAHSRAVKNFGVYGPFAEAGLPYARRTFSWAVWACASVRANPAARGAAPNSFNTPRREVPLMPLLLPGRPSQVALAPLVGDVLGGAPGQAEDGPGGVLVGVAHERARVGHEHVL